MKKPPQDLERRILFILHRAFVEMRLLGSAGANIQVQDLSDALEVVPGWLTAWQDDYLDILKENLKAYQSKYPNAFDYLGFIEKYDPPAF
jgi:hypothetical protein